MENIVNITNLTEKIDETGSEVSALVDGDRLWFRSSDKTLCLSPEGFLSAILFPAMQFKRSIRIDASLDPAWLSNIQKLMRIYYSWWKIPQIEITHQNQPDEGNMAVRNKKALCFSGGVDSFYSLLQNQNELDLLIFVAGYDIPLEDINRIRSFEQVLLEVGKQTETRSVTVFTNLRSHPFYEEATWGQSHGGALAAIGHLLGNVKTLLISASYPYVYHKPWGSHFQTDYLWSSSCMEVKHYGADLWRAEKLIKIKDEFLVQNYLRVCWENRNDDFNCCECEKCLRTMLILKQSRTLGKFPVFKYRDRLEDSINRLSYLRGDLLPVYRKFVKHEDMKDIKQALKKLIWRSQWQHLRNLTVIKIRGYLARFN